MRSFKFPALVGALGAAVILASCGGHSAALPASAPVVAAPQFEPDAAVPITI